MIAQLNNSAATNWDIEFVKLYLNEMIVKGIINEICKTLTTFMIEDISPTK